MLAFLLGACFMLIADSVVLALGGDLKSDQIVFLTILLFFLIRPSLATLYRAHPRAMLRVGLLLLALDIGGALLIHHLRSL